MIEADLDADGDIPPGTVWCYVCLIGSHRTKIVRFSLTRSVIVAGRKTTRGAGVISLCQSCWSKGPRTEMVKVRIRHRG